MVNPDRREFLASFATLDRLSLEKTEADLVLKNGNIITLLSTTTSQMQRRPRSLETGSSPWGRTTTSSTLLRDVRAASI